MSGTKLTDEFKRDAVAQVEDRGYRMNAYADRYRCNHLALV